MREHFVRGVLMVAALAAIATSASAYSVNLDTGFGTADKREVAEALGFTPQEVDSHADTLQFVLSDGTCRKVLVTTPQRSKGGKLFNRFSFLFSGFQSNDCTFTGPVELQVEGFTVY